MERELKIDYTIFPAEDGSGGVAGTVYIRNGERIREAARWYGKSVGGFVKNAIEDCLSEVLAAMEEEMVGRLPHDPGRYAPPEC